MKWGMVQKLIEALLAGDHQLIKDGEARIALLLYAYEDLINLTEVLSLETELSGLEYIRDGWNDTKLRRPGIPADDDAELEIDVGLCFVVARLIASYVSKNKFELHKRIALELVEVYNAKVYAYRDKMAELGTGDEKTYIKADQYVN